MYQRRLETKPAQCKNGAHDRRTRTIEVCIGLGYGTVLRIGDNEIWGAEVNAASKLGEDMAKGGHVLATDSLRQALADQPFVECGVLFGNRPVYRLSA